MEIAAAIIAVIIVIAATVKSYNDRKYGHGGKPSALPMNTAIKMRNTSSWKRANTKRIKKMKREMRFM